MSQSKKPTEHAISEPLTCNSCQQLKEQVLSLTQQVALLTEQARTDALTGLFNYRHFTDALQTEMERVRRTVQPMSIILIDIDHFKQFNDTHGHDVGNIALAQVAQLLADAVRKLDVACRFGGEEFVIILPATPLVYATLVAERMRVAVERAPIMHDGQALPITISLGVAVHEPSMSTSSADLLARADTLLYDAKSRGRNCVSSAKLPSVEPKPMVTAEEKSALFSYGRSSDNNPGDSENDNNT